MSTVDPNEVLMSGERSFVRSSPDGGKTLCTRPGHWRVLWCPARSARPSMNGRLAEGTAWSERPADRPSSTPGLAWSATRMEPARLSARAPSGRR